MRLSLPRGVLKFALDKIVAANDGTSKMPPFLRIQGFGNALQLSTSNTHLSAQILIKDVAPHDPFLIGVGAKNIREIVQSLPDGDISLSITETACHIRGVSSAFKVSILTPDTSPGVFSSATEFNGVPYQPLKFDLFFSAVSKVIYCTNDKEEGRAYARGVIITESGFYGSDGFRIANFPNGILFVPAPILVPVRVLKNLIKVFDGLGPDGSVFIDKTRILFANNGLYAAVKLLAETTPNVAAVIPRDQPIQQRAMIRSDFIASVKRALIVASEHVPKAAFAFDGDQLFIRAEHEGNTSEEVLDCSPGPEPFEVVLNLKFVLEAAMALEGEFISFELRDPDKAIVLVDSTREHMNIIMPMRGQDYNE